MKHRKQALAKSLLALLMCVAMLVSTTFAWFTDSVTSGINTIAAGNLDVELYHSNAIVTNQKVTESTDLFLDLQGNPILWEPGVVSYENLRVVNEGDLALVYQLALNVANENYIIDNGNQYGLSQVLKVGVVEDGITATDRDSVISAVSGWTKLENLAREGSLLADGEKTWGIVIYWQPTANDDNWNANNGKPLSSGDALTIDLGIHLTATQTMHENDSFGNDYDVSAKDDVFPSFGGGTASAPVDVANGVTTSAVEIAIGDITASIPAGVKVKDGTTALALSIKALDSSAANIVLGENEALRSLDVHIEGVAEDNTTPITVTLPKVAPVALNMGNYKLYHVENGATNEMTLVASGTAFDAHNQFKYDPATGDVVLYMATFSEVALAVEEAKWEGNFNYDWYNTTDTVFTIANADQLAAFGAIVGGMKKVTGRDDNTYTYGDKVGPDDFAGKTVTLMADINLGDDEDHNNANLIFYPIGYYNSTGSYEKTSGGSVTSSVSSFEGTFDGNGHTIANFYQNTWEMFGDYNSGYSGTPNHYKDAMGLFGYVLNGTIKNLTVSNFSSDGEFTPTGVIAAYADGNSNFENIAITNCNPRVYNTGNGGIIGIAGDTSAANDDHITLKNVTVDNSNKISALWGSWDVACGGLVGMYRGNVDGSGNATGDTISFENCHVSAQIDVYNDVCANYQYYAYRYAGMIIGSVRHNTTNNEGKTVPNMTGISATGCTVNYGDWNDYYYCEFEKNTMASYSEDYQFSRVPHSELNFTDSNGNGVVDADERASVTGCKHDHTAEENHQAIYLPFHQLFTGYSWGVSSIGLKEYSGIVTDLGITEGDQEESVKKFETKFTGDFLYRVGNQNTVSLGSLFEYKDTIAEKDQKDAGVWVTVEKVDEKMNVSGTFTANTTEWEKGTIQFSGTGVVKVTIQDYNFCIPTVLYLEVVDAKNTTTASFSGNTVLLQDVSTSSTLSASGVVYGNGFTVNMENAPISEKNGAVFHLYDGAFLKNLGIVGKEFTTVAMNVNDTNYGVSAVRAWGTVTIENCYISGCRSAVSVTGTELTIKDSVIANGVYANVDFRSGILNLHNVTTINEPHSVDGTTIVGLGIVGNMTASAGRQINITGTLTQYNWVSQSDCSNIKASGINSVFNSVFTDDKYASLRYQYNNTPYVNTGILSLCSDFGKSAMSGIPSNYGGMDVTATISNVTVDGYVWAPAQASTLTANDMKYHDAEYQWTVKNQGTSFVPSAFDFAGADIEQENNVAQIEYENGSSYKLSKETIKKLLTPTKYNKALSFKVSMDGTDYTDKDIVFDRTASEKYTITYTITDDVVYDKNGILTSSTYEITKTLSVFATVVDKGADAPTFTFYYGTKGSASAGTPHTTQPTNSYTSTIKQVGEAYYIMPNVSAATTNAIGSQAVDAQTVYYPIVDGINVRSGSSTDYDFTRYYPVFKAVKISDNGTEYTYSGTKEMPATVAWVSATIDSGNGASALNDGFGLYNNQYLCKIQKKAGNAESGGTSVVKYSYTALDGNTYYYYVGYRFYDEDEGGVCVTPDTLITLADGSQARVDSLKGDEQLLVWNHETGKLDKAPVAYIVNHDAVVAEREVYHLTFANGKTVKIIGEHVFFDATLNKYVALDSGAADYIGHEFLGLADNGVEKVKLVSVEKKVYETSAYEVVSYKHLTCFTNDMLSTSAYLDQLLNVFDINTDTFAYDAESVVRDIETYGLYTYADFEGLISEDAFELYDAQYLKIAIGKGYITWDDICALIDIYFNVEIQPLN